MFMKTTFTSVSVLVEVAIRDCSTNESHLHEMFGDQYLNGILAQSKRFSWKELGCYICDYRLWHPRVFNLLASSISLPFKWWSRGGWLTWQSFFSVSVPVWTQLSRIDPRWNNWVWKLHGSVRPSLELRIITMNMLLKDNSLLGQQLTRKSISGSVFEVNVPGITKQWTLSWNTKIWFINGVDIVNWPPHRDWKATALRLKADVSSVSPSSERILRQTKG